MINWKRGNWLQGKAREVD